MYGFIYNTLRTLIVNKFGEQTWKELCDEAECPLMKDGIVDRHYYDESFLGRVGIVAEKRLNLPLEKILEMFGNLFFEVCKKSGHSGMLRTLGHNLFGFLMNLDSLHDHLSFTYTEMQAPSFICEKTATGLTLHYYSQRPGLSSIVIGIVKAVAKDFYSLVIDMEMVKYKEIKQKLAHHYIFDIEVKESNRDENYHERLTGEPLVISPTHTVLEEREVSFSLTDLSNTTSGSLCPFAGMDIGSPMSPDCPEVGISHDEKLKARLSASRMVARRGSAFPMAQWPISQPLFQNCFPFHILFDKDLTIRFMGVSLSRLFPKAIIKGEKLSDLFQLTRPALVLNYENIRGSIHNIFIMRMNRDSSNGFGKSDALHFRGQMIPTSSCVGSQILFLGSPRVNSIEELEHQGLYLSDIPIHDVTRDLIMLNHHFRVEMGIAKELEETKRDLQIQKGRAEEEKHRADELLHAMLPLSVANELKKNQAVSAMDFPSVTILFSDIKGFTNICNRCSPIQVVDMLNRLYIHFDGQLEVHNVYKVETIGDAYMVAAGLLDTSKDHAAAVTNMAFTMRQAAGNVMDPVNNEPIKIRIGVHSGGVVAGVVGLKMPRFCLFGDTVNTASRMESHGEPGRIHISVATYDLISDRQDQYAFYNRGEIEVKGLGLMHTFFVESPTSNEDLSEIIYMKPQESEKNLTEQNDLLRSSLQLPDGVSHNSSFITLTTCSRVQPTHPKTPQFDKPPTPISNGSRNLEMARPAQVYSTISVTPTPEVTESTGSLDQTSPNGQHNRVSSLFISDTQNDKLSSLEFDVPTDNSHSRQKSKLCNIS